MNSAQDVSKFIILNLDKTCSKFVLATNLTYGCITHNHPNFTYIYNVYILIYKTDTKSL